VPGVSNMFTDLGGLTYTASAFNGWYMSTEVVRDFTDPQRYDMLKVHSRPHHYDECRDSFLRSLVTTFHLLSTINDVVISERTRRTIR